MRGVIWALLLWVVGSWAIGSLGAEEAPKAPKDLVGTWVFAEDRTTPKLGPGRRNALGQGFVFAQDGDALVLTFIVGNTERVHRYALDGTEESVTEGRGVARHRARWEDGQLHIDTALESTREGGSKSTTVTQHVITPSSEGLVVEFRITHPVQAHATSFYKRAPEGAAPAKATIEALAWLSGAWTGTLGSVSIEERWSPPLGGAMLATARTVKGTSMVAFEFLRIVQRGSGLVYVAQPGGMAATEFVLTQVSAGKAVFENPAHDFPQRITYELGTDGALTAEIAGAGGARAQKFHFRREPAAAPPESPR